MRKPAYRKYEISIGTSQYPPIILRYGVELERVGPTIGGLIYANSSAVHNSVDRLGPGERSEFMVQGGDGARIVVRRWPASWTSNTVAGRN